LKQLPLVVDDEEGPLCHKMFLEMVSGKHEAF